MIDSEEPCIAKIQYESLASCFLAI